MNKRALQKLQRPSSAKRPRTDPRRPTELEIMCVDYHKLRRHIKLLRFQLELEREQTRLYKDRWNTLRYPRKEIIQTPHPLLAESNHVMRSQEEFKQFVSAVIMQYGIDLSFGKCSKKTSCAASSMSAGIHSTVSGCQKTQSADLRKKEVARSQIASSKGKLKLTSSDEVNEHAEKIVSNDAANARARNLPWKQVKEQSIKVAKGLQHHLETEATISSLSVAQNRIAKRPAFSNFQAADRSNKRLRGEGPSQRPSRRTGDKTYIRGVLAGDDAKNISGRSQNDGFASRSQGELQSFSSSASTTSSNRSRSKNPYYSAYSNRSSRRSGTTSSSADYSGRQSRKSTTYTYSNSATPSPCRSTDSFSSRDDYTDHNNGYPEQQSNNKSRKSVFERLGWERGDPRASAEQRRAWEVEDELQWYLDNWDYVMKRMPQPTTQPAAKNCDDMEIDDHYNGRKSVFGSDGKSLFKI
ncbi:hypothetical protein BKA69DRAFT_1124795 [Paraphysoderma sedebokerense]|nr:hypothetical protein BKA69DRAFT_1124795 [Paraphysoderma sedebokerense]